MLLPNAAKEHPKIKVGIYPAAFDPVHNGHLAFARAVKDTYRLDKVFFLPDPNPVHKQGVKALEHRANMVHLAIANEDAFGVLVLDLQEFDIRHVWPRITARFLGSELFMLVGNNAVKRLAGWPHTSEFGKQAPTFVIAARNKSDEETNKAVQTLLHTKKLHLPYEIMPATYETFSSQGIRTAIKQGQSPEGLPLSVQEYISRNRLYQSTQT